MDPLRGRYDGPSTGLPSGPLSGSGVEGEYEPPIGIVQGLSPGGPHELVGLPIRIDLMGGFPFSLPKAHVPPRMNTPAPKALAARAPVMYKPPAMPQRDFRADYPTAERFADAAGRLTRDIEGNPLNARWIVGRRLVGGEEKAFPTPKLDALAEALTGRGPESVSRSDPGHPLQGDDGGLAAQFAPDGRFEGQYGIFLADDLSKDAYLQTLGHEIGHSVDLHTAPPETRADLNAGRFGTRPDDPYIEEQLYRVCRDMNAPGAEHFGPTDAGYTREQAPAELWAEAPRAYLTDPNYMKTVAPDAARVIRETWNSHPEFSRVLQFNALPPFVTAVGGALGGALGLLGTSQSQDASSATTSTDIA